MSDSDFELRVGEEGGFVFAFVAGFSSVCDFSIFTEKWEPGPPTPPINPALAWVRGLACATVQLRTCWLAAPVSVSGNSRRKSSCGNN